MQRIILSLLLLCVLPLMAQNKKKSTINTKIPNGYDSVTWGTKLTSVKGNIKGKLYFTDDKTIIISKQSGIEYNYGFFYIDPALSSTDDAKDKSGTNDKKPDEGELFYVSIKFPYLSLDVVKKKMEDKYGPSTNENINKMQGAIAWNGKKTIIIMWVDRYEDKPFCRRITYLSKEIALRLNKYQQNVFNQQELTVIKKLVP